MPVLGYNERMAANRRAFLKLAGGIGAVRGVGGMAGGGGLGRVVFCRASRRTAAWLPLLLPGALPVCEEIDRDEVVLCGTEATVVIDASGYRRFA